MTTRVTRTVLALLTVAAVTTASSAAAVHARDTSVAAPAAATCKGSGKLALVARVRSVAGGLEVRQQSQGKWRKARAKTPIHQGELARSGKGQRAAIGLCDGATLYLNQQTEVAFTAKLVAQAKRGEVDEVLPTGLRDIIQTRLARTQAVGDAPANVDVRIVQKQNIVTAARGTVHVTTKQGSIQVGVNQETTVAPRQAPTAPVTVNAASIVSWTAPLRPPPSWSVLAQGDDLKSSAGIALDGAGNVYVTTGNHQILKLSPKGTVLARWGSEGSGPGQFEWNTADTFPGITMDTRGNIYVADTRNHRIQKLSPTGTPLAQWGDFGDLPGQLNNPEGLALDTQGDIHVVDSGNQRLQELSPTGQPVAQMGSYGSDPGQFDFPTGIAIDSQGNLYVTDWGNSRIEKLSGTGTPLAQWGSPGSNPGQFHFPIGIALDAQGDIYVADAYRIQAFSPTGQLLKVWGKEGTGPGEFDSAYGIALDRSGNIYAVDKGNNRIEKLSDPGIID